MDERDTFCVGVFAGAHGVRGEAKVRTFTEAPENIAAYGPLRSPDGARTFTLKVVRCPKPNLAIVRAPEIASREDALALKGVELHADKSRLPPPGEDEFYIDDLIGLAAVGEDGAPLGRVAAVHNFGAGDVLELRDVPGQKGPHLTPFTKDAASVDFAGGKIVIARDFAPGQD